MLCFPIGFQDANFARRRVWCRSDLQGIHQRWMPFGMPRLNPTFSNMVFFLYGRNPDTGEVEGPIGTGFFVGVEATTTWYIRHVYAVTCQHNVVGGASIIRLNTKDGKSRFIELDIDQWQVIKGGNDIAAIDVTEEIAKVDDEFSCVPLGLFATREFLTSCEIGIGEDGFMLGLFANHPGSRRNLIAARFGNVSLLASNDEPLRQPNGFRHPSHVFDMGSRTGFSGSPVFIYRTPSADLRDIAYGPRSHGLGGVPLPVMSGGIAQSASQLFDSMEARQNTFLRLFGLHVGQFHEQVVARKVDVSRENVEAVMDGDKLEIPGSMSLVVPAWAILELLNLPINVEQRRARDAAMKKQADKENVAKPESAHASSTESSDDNPHHKEDFTGLLNAAARKKPQGA